MSSVLNTDKEIDLILNEILGNVNYECLKPQDETIKICFTDICTVCSGSSALCLPSKCLCTDHKLSIPH